MPVKAKSLGQMDTCLKFGLCIRILVKLILGPKYLNSSTNAICLDFYIYRNENAKPKA